MLDVFERSEQIAQTLAEGAAEAEALGQLPDKTARMLKDTGVIRMLQSSDWNGYEAHPVDFCEVVMQLAASCGSTGWVAGIVGVHPWEMAFADRRVQEEIWGDDPETWIASPYAPMGRAVRVDGGFVLNGRWQFSSGTDHCQWIFLGGIVLAEDGTVGSLPDQRHFLLPRADYAIVPESWNVFGLRGTGSKDIIVKDAFVPEYRTLSSRKVVDGRAAIEARREEPLYRMSFGAIFPSGIASATVGICEAALGAIIAYQRQRTNFSGATVSDDPWMLTAIGEAAAEVNASRQQLLGNLYQQYKVIERGGELTLQQRIATRRDQTRSTWRAVAAIDSVFDKTGGRSLYSEQPLQRMWRDSHAALHHIINVSDQVCNAYTQVAMGTPLDDIDIYRLYF